MPPSEREVTLKFALGRSRPSVGHGHHGPQGDLSGRAGQLTVLLLIVTEGGIIRGRHHQDLYSPVD